VQRKSANLINSSAEATGEVTALASVFGNVDRGGDRILPGAFAGALEKWRQRGRPIPIVASHKHDDPWAIIGAADPDDVSETSEGLLVKGQLDIEDNELAKQVHRLMQRGTLTKGGQETKDGVTEISEISDLFEVGPTLIGMNAEAQLVEAKSADAPPFSEELAFLGSILSDFDTFKERENNMVREIEALATKSAKQSRRTVIRRFEVD
jgi:HK97 family phage prohead protease